MNKKIECLIMDWAGTAVDYGCFAPVAAFVESFKSIGTPVTPEETRAHMGLTKIEEVRALFNINRVKEQFKEKYGRDHNDEDIQQCYKKFQEVLFGTLEEYSKPITGVAETIASLREKGIKVGSTTGYTRKMMDVVIPEAEKLGYKIDNCVTSDNLPGGRPKPYMIYQNLCDLDIDRRDTVIKVGDTISDIKEGVNAGVWSIGVISGSNELAMTEAEVKSMSCSELDAKMKKVRNKMYEAGADYVIDSITDLPELIEVINSRMSN